MSVNLKYKHQQKTYQLMWQELEKYGVCISIKSACSITISPSRSVMAITHDRKRALSSWRISLSHLVKEEEIKKSIVTTYRKKIWSK